MAFSGLPLATLLLVAVSLAVVIARPLPKELPAHVKERDVHEILAKLSPRSCPNDCGEHGHCQSNNCVCDDTYFGIDCSIEVITLENNVEYNGNVPLYDWLYFNIDVPVDTDDFGVYMREEAPGSDCDVYVRYDGLPQRMYYDLKDNDINQIYELHMEQPQPGEWFIGVFGWQNCDNFYIKAVLSGGTGQCPLGCSGHGNCVEGVCDCDPEYRGNDCSVHTPSLVSGVVVENQQVDNGQWMYYQVIVAPNDDVPVFTVTVHELDGGNEDTDMYIKLNEMPSFFAWDARNPGYDHDYAISFDDPDAGTYFIGVYGFIGGRYTIQVDIVQECPNQCSQHGTCYNDHCTCSDYFEGDECETMIPEIPLDTWQEGYVNHRSWNYYHITAASSTNMVVFLEQQTPGIREDCDVYIRSGVNPSYFSFEFFDVGVSESFEVVVENPQDQTWHIGVNGYTACDYRLKVFFRADCPGDCTGHGTCDDGRCMCDEGWMGEDCSAAVITLENKVAVESEVQRNQWEYFKITVPEGSTSLTVYLKEEDPNSQVGQLWTYVNQGAPPSLVLSGWSDVASDTTQHIIYFRRDTANEDQNFYVGIYGNPNIANDRAIPFKLVAYFPPF